MIEASTKEELYVILGERLGVSRTSVIKRVNKLGLQIHKTKDKAWLDPEQLQLLDDMNQCIADGGTMDQFIADNNLTITTFEDKSKEIKLQEEAVNVYTSDGVVNQMAQLINSAQQRAAGILITERALTSQYLANPELLHQDLQDKISHYEAKCLPAPVDAEEFARQLLSQYDEGR